MPAPTLTLEDVQRMDPTRLADAWPDVLRDRRTIARPPSDDIARAETARRRLVELPGAAAALIEKYRTDRMALESRRDLFGAPREKARRELREAALAELATLRASLEAESTALLGACRRARHARPAMDVATLAGWDRLKGAIAGSRDPQGAAIARLQRAQADGDTALIVGAAYMLEDHFVAQGFDLLFPATLEWLDAIAGDGSTVAAIALEHEAQQGIAWVTQAVGLAGLEIEHESNLPAAVMPTYERGELLRPGAPPDYQGAAIAAARAAGVR